MRSVRCIIGCTLFALLAWPRPLPAADDDAVDKFILPETPPTIERLRKPPLDRPLLRKQNFISEKDIASPPVLLEVGFPSLSAETGRPVSVTLLRGNLATAGGDFFCSSPAGWKLSYHNLLTEGDAPNLAREINALAIGVNRTLEAPVVIAAEAGAGQRRIWDERQRYYRASGSVAWNPAGHMAASFSAAGERGELESMEHTQTFGGSATLAWFPFPEHRIEAGFSGRSATAFIDGQITGVRLEYTAMPVENMVFSGGSAVENGRLYPRASWRWQPVSRAAVTVAYEPGQRIPEWREMFEGNFYFRAPRGLALPETPFSLREELSYYRGDADTVTLALSQEDWRNHVSWAQAAGDSFISVQSIPSVYLSRISLRARHRGKIWSPRVELTAMPLGDLPLVPALEAGAAVGCSFGSWTVEPAFRSVGSRYADFAQNRKLAAYFDLSVSVRRLLVAGIDLSVRGTNLLSERQELQPGFVTASPAVTAGLTVSF